MEDWAEVSEAYRLYLITRGYSGETIHGYLGYVVIVWRWFHFRDRPLSDVTAREVANFLSASKKGHSQNTVRNFTTALRSFFRYCIAEGLREDDPTKGFSTRKPKMQPRQPLSMEEAKAMHEAITDPRDRAAFLLLLSTGIRIGELCGINIQDIDWRRSLILVHGKGSKERWVPITPVALAAVKVIADKRKIGPLFLTIEGTPMDRERVRKRLVNVGDRAGVVHVYPHRFRITFANEFLEAGGDMGALQSVLGHEEITTTNHYAGYSRAQRGIDQARKLDLGGMLSA